MFDDFGRGFFRTPFRRPIFEPELFGELGTVPAVDIAEDENEYEIRMELPGMESGDVDAPANHLLTVTGEKKAENEERTKDYFLTERCFDSFRRSFRVRDSVDVAGVAASFDKGVLTVALPKRAEAQWPETKIDVKAGWEPADDIVARARRVAWVLTLLVLAWVGFMNDRRVIVASSVGGV